MTTTKRKNPTADQLLASALAEDPELRKEWEEGEPAYQLALQTIRARRARGWSQAQLAEAMGTTQAVVSRLERMESKPSLETADRAARALGLHLQIRFADEVAIRDSVEMRVERGPGFPEVPMLKVAALQEALKQFSEGAMKQFRESIAELVDRIREGQSTSSRK